MFENDLYKRAESTFASNLRAALNTRDTQCGKDLRQEGVGAGQLVDVWEKSEDLARRIALLVDLELPFPIFGRYDEEYDEEDNEADGSHIKPRAFSNLFLAIYHVLSFQPEKTTGHVGLFNESIELEREVYRDRPVSGAYFANWPSEPFHQYSQVRRYRLEDDPLYRSSGQILTDLRTHEEALFVAFQGQYMFVSDLDEEYEAFIRMFCWHTLILAGYCMDFCIAMASWNEGSRDKETATETHAIDEFECLARIVVLSRGIASHGLRVGYLSWLETLDSR